MLYINIYVHIFADNSKRTTVPGYKDIWVLGDEFVANSVNQYFKTACNTLMRGLSSTGTHCGNNYEIKLFHATRYTSHIRNMIARLVNTFANAVNEEKLLPRAVVIVLEDDLINYVNIHTFGMSMVFGKILHYIFSEFNKIITAKKDILKPKSRRNCYSELLWINPPFNKDFSNNPQHSKFGKALNTTASIYADNWSLQLKRIWDTQSQDLFIPGARRFSSKGLMTYWMVVDRTIRFWDTALSPLSRRHTVNSVNPVSNQVTSHCNNQPTNQARGNTQKFRWYRSQRRRRNNES